MSSPKTSISGPRTIGRYEIRALETGSFALDGGAMFGIIPKPLWEKTNPADESNRIDLRARCLLLIERGKRVVLVDTGMGDKWAEKFRAMYKIDNARWLIDAELAKHGLKAEDVTDIIATHLHFDHMGGATRRLPSGELVPTFPNARVHLQERNWKLANQPNEKDRGSYLRENFDVYQGSSKLQLLTTPDGATEEILPGLRVRVSHGHTEGMQLVEVSDEKSCLFYCADAVPTSSHVRVPYVMGYDCFPLTMMEEKKKLLREAEERGALLFFEHCPRAEAASVMHDGRDFAVRQTFHFG